MKKRNFVLTSITLGLSILSTPMLSTANQPLVVEGQSLPSLAPMLEKVLPAVVSISVEGKHRKISLKNLDVFLEMIFSVVASLVRANSEVWVQG